MIVEVLILRKNNTMCPQVPPVANERDGADAAQLHTNRAELGSNRVKRSVELLRSMDQIYEDSD
jgi:hypothetical protein